MVGSFAAVPAALSLFLLLVLLAKRPVSPPDRWLGLWLLAQSLFFGSAVIASAVPGISLWFLILAQCCLFALGPAQYLYAAAVLDAPRHYPWHAAYILLSLLLLGAAAAAIDLRIESGALVADGVPRWMVRVLTAFSILPAIYPAAVLRLTAAYSSHLQDRVSFLATGDLGWLRIWAWTSLAATIALALVIVAAGTGGWSVTTQVALSFALQTASIAYAGYRGLTRPGIFLSFAQPPARRPGPQIDAAEAAADFRTVEQALAAEKPHLKPDLTAQELADQLGWAPDRLTRAFRHGGDTSFFDAINKARVQEVQALAEEPRNARMSLLALGHEAGFGSKSAFYDAFRRHAGCSPAAWRRDRPIQES